jgi:hypothetical protein
MSHTSSLAARSRDAFDGDRVRGIGKAVLAGDRALDTTQSYICNRLSSPQGPTIAGSDERG